MNKCRMVAARLTKELSRLTVVCWSGTRRLGYLALDKANSGQATVTSLDDTLRIETSIYRHRPHAVVAEVTDVEELAPTVARDIVAPASYIRSPQVL